MRLSDQEWAILLATRISENALSLADLAEAAEVDVVRASVVVAGLVERQILWPLENFDGTIVYAYADNARAQRVYAMILREV
jgi:hypothetical protein